jgi:hypothetical protein
MKYAIIEDEQIAMQNLDQMIRQLRPHYQKIFQTDTAEETIKSLMSDLKPDLLFMDIELSDANCFTIFEKVDVKVPIIFTTAYDEYAIKAFTVNSIDYLLKPISKDNLLRAIEKIESLSINTPIDYRKLGPEVFQRSKRQRILITIGDKYTYVNMADVAYFEREEKYVCAVLFNGKKYITDFLNLSEVEAIVNPDDFCLISRSIIVNIQAISSVYKWFNNRLKVTITCGDNTEEILVSSARRKIFLDWLGG